MQQARFKTFLSNSNAISMHHKKKTGFVKCNVALFSISKHLFLLKSLKSYALNGCVISCSKYMIPLKNINYDGNYRRRQSCSLSTK